MPAVELHAGSVVDVEVAGSGPTVLLAVDPVPMEGPAADELRAWGVDPALGRSLIDGLRNRFRVVAVPYERHLLAAPRPDSLTPDTVAADLLAVADAVGAQRFAYYGYSWLAMAGLQLAIRTDRLTGLVMGGFPPLGGPYAEMLTVTTATHRMSVLDGTPATARPTDEGTTTDRPAGDELDWSTVEVSLTKSQTRQFVTLYRALEGFDDRSVQDRITCPRLCFAGSADAIEYGERWGGGVRVDIAGPLVHRRAEIEALGWDVRVLDGLDHTQAMQPGQVLPLLRSWLSDAIAG
jgi:pimeloyl-ACP methyl ester carboxylesterase